MKAIMKKWYKPMCVSVCALVLMGGLAGCGGKAEPAPSKEPSKTETPGEPQSEAPSDDDSSKTGSVMLYSSMQEDQLIAVKEGFLKKYPNIKIEYYFAGTSKVITKIATEAQSGQVDADVIWVGDPADYVSFKKENILQPYASPEASTIDPAYVDSEGYYTGARLMNMGIAYNTNLVTEEEAPKSWEDLLDSKWSDQIVTTDPGSSEQRNTGEMLL